MQAHPLLEINSPRQLRNVLTSPGDYGILQVSAPDSAKESTQGVLPMLEAGPSSLLCWCSSKSARECFDLPWRWLNFLGSSPRFLLGSYLKSFLHVGLRCMPGTSTRFFPGMSKSVLAFSGDGCPIAFSSGSSVLEYLLDVFNFGAGLYLE